MHEVEKDMFGQNYGLQESNLRREPHSEGNKEQLWTLLVEDPGSSVDQLVCSASLLDGLAQ